LKEMYFKMASSILYNSRNIYDEEEEYFDTNLNENHSSDTGLLNDIITFKMNIVPCGTFYDVWHIFIYTFLFNGLTFSVQILNYAEISSFKLHLKFQLKCFTRLKTNTKLPHEGKANHVLIG
jgi:hypothetical protein